MKKFFFMLMLFTALFNFSCVKNVLNPEYTIKLTPDKLEKEVKKHFPLEEKFSYGKVLFSDPIINIKGSRLKLGAEYGISTLSLKPFQGKIVISGNVSYNRDDRTIYLTTPLVEKLSLKGVFNIQIKPEYVKNIVSEKSLERFIRIPLYRFKSKTAERVKSIKIENGAVLVTLTL